MLFESVGLIVNPAAGLGAERNLLIARETIQALRPKYILTGPGQLGASAVPESHVLEMPALAGRTATQWVARAAANHGVDALVVIGGDGTMADVASAIIDVKNRCPILGVGVGSINAGELITCQAEEVGKLSKTGFSIERVNALEAACNGERKTLAFNDVVIGATIVGMLDGTLMDLDANAFLHGRQAPGNPQTIGTASSLVTKKTGDHVVEIAHGEMVGTVVVGFAHQDCFYGKAVAGAVILSALVGDPAGCLVCEQPLVRVQLEAGALRSVEPVRSIYTGLRETDVIQVTGVGWPAVLCVDGNPMTSLKPEDQVHIRVHTNIVDVIRMVE
jgi:hypothetical protein